MIEMREVSFSYFPPKGEAISVFDKFNLFIPAGRYISLMGPNGSGKTTLGKLIKGILTPTSGLVKISGQVLQAGEVSPRVGYIFSNPENQIVSSVVEEDVAFGLGNLGLDRQTMAKRVEHGLAMVGMEEYRYAAPHYLSGGQQQKIVLAGILAMDCEILVLDEPTSMLDLQDQEEILNLLSKIHAEKGKTILHITHSFSAAIRAQDFIYLDRGRILFYGSWPDYFAKFFIRNPFNLAYPPPWELLRRLGEEGVAIPGNLSSLEDIKRFISDFLFEPR